MSDIYICGMSYTFICLITSPTMFDCIWCGSIVDMVQTWWSQAIKCCMFIQTWIGFNDCCRWTEHSLVIYLNLFMRTNSRRKNDRLICDICLLFSEFFHNESIYLRSRKILIVVSNAKILYFCRRIIILHDIDKLS